MIPGRAVVVMEPAEGIEPTTYRLQGDCSAVELRRHASGYCTHRHNAVPASREAVVRPSAGAAALDLELDLALHALERVVDGLDVPAEKIGDLLV